jgi:hypothetical protein
MQISKLGNVSKLSSCERSRLTLHRQTFHRHGPHVARRLTGAVVAVAAIALFFAITAFSDPPAPKLPGSPTNSGQLTARQPQAPSKREAGPPTVAPAPPGPAARSKLPRKPSNPATVPGTSTPRASALAPQPENQLPEAPHGIETGASAAATPTHSPQTKAQTEENKDGVAVKLKWIDLLIALPPVLASLILGLWGHRASSKDGDRGLGSILGTITRGLAIVSAVIFLSLLGFLWIAAKRVTVPYNDDTVKRDLSLTLQRDLQGQLDVLERRRQQLDGQLALQREKAMRDFLRQEVLPAIRSDFGKYASDLKSQSNPNLIAENASLKAQLEIMRGENSKLWQIMVGRPDFFRRPVDWGRAPAEATPLSFTWQLLVAYVLLAIGGGYLTFRLWSRNLRGHMYRLEAERERHERRYYESQRPPG